MSHLSPHCKQPRPTVPTHHRHHWLRLPSSKHGAPPEEELIVDSCFDIGDDENVDEPVRRRLNAGDVGARRSGGTRGNTDPLSGVACLIGTSRSRSACVDSRSGIVAVYVE